MSAKTVLMKQTEMFRKAKPRFCNWLLLRPPRTCGAPATVMIRKALYCDEHAGQAEKMFGPATPISQRQFERGNTHGYADLLADQDKVKQQTKG